MPPPVLSSLLLDLAWRALAVGALVRPPLPSAPRPRGSQALLQRALPPQRRARLLSRAAAASAAQPAASPTAAAAGKPEPEESPSPRVRVGPPGLEKYPSDSKIRPPAGITRPRRMSETFEGSAYDIFGSMDEQKGGDLGVFSGMPRLPGRRRVVLRKVGSLFRWKSFTNK